MFKAKEAVVKYKTESAPLDHIGKPADVYQFFKNKLHGETRENFYCLYLDIKNRIICFERISTGTSNMALIDQKEIVRTALLVGAERVILVHNHPSGVPDPSREDLALTIQVKNACDVFSIELLDHVIIGDSFVSVKERGYI